MGKRSRSSGHRVAAALIALAVVITGVVVFQAAENAGSDLVTNTLTPVADCVRRERGADRRTSGRSPRLVVDASPVRESYLRFDLASLTGPVQEARLRIHVANVTDAESPSGGSVALVNNNTWTETAITYNNRPTTWGDTVASFGAVGRNTWVEVPVTHDRGHRRRPHASASGPPTATAPTSTAARRPRPRRSSS